MKHEMIPIMAAVLCGLSFFALPVYAKYGGGTGEPNNPYRIATGEHLNDIDNHPEDLDKDFVVVADIDLSQFTGTQFNIIGGSYRDAFTGVFDGNDHVISNFSYTHPSACHSSTCWNVGLFGFAGSGAHIKNVILRDSNIYYLSHRVGTLVGSLSHATVSSCRVENASVEADEFVGGLVGFNSKGTIENSYADAYVTGYRLIGGLVGVNDDSSTISQCFSSGAVSGTGDQIGGLSGLNDGVVSKCYSMASVTASRYVGGLVGRNRENGTIFYCYSAGSVSGYRSGGLVGRNYGAVIGSFWDTQTSGQPTSAGGTGKTTAEMQTASTYIGWGECGQVWTIDELNDYPRLWWENVPGEIIVTPLLSDLVAGTGTQSDPYLIYTPEELNLIGLFACEWDKHFLLCADVDLAGFTGTSFNIIGYPFSGVFDGRGHKISNFSYSAPGTTNIGIFGVVNGTNAQIKHLGLINPNIDGTGDRVGSLVGYLINGTIDVCYAQNINVSGNDIVGGLVGKNYYGTISNCYSVGSIRGADCLGVLVGQNYSTIYNCYSAGSVLGTGGNIGGLVGVNSNGEIFNSYSAASASGDDDIGGLVGLNYNSSLVLNCYSIGKVSGNVDVGGLVGDTHSDSKTTNSFWDTQTSEFMHSDGGIGKTTAQMQTRSTFTNVGWDFSTPIWVIDERKDYPKLWKENTPPVAVPGPNQIAYACIDVIAEVKLDGLDSYDIDGDSLSYYWSWTVDGNTLTATDPNLTIELPVGEHIIQLIVSDGIDDSEPDHVVVTVIEPLESLLWIAPRVINRHSRQPGILALLRLPEGITTDQIDSGEPLLLYPGGIEAIRQRVTESRRQGVSIFALFDKAELMDAVSANGSVELQVVGQLKTGQYFGGTDTVRIISPRDDNNANGRPRRRRQRR